MATSLASQLQAIKSHIKATDSAPLKQPFTRPSIIFDPKEAADIDLDTIFSIALSGLETLLGMDGRFKSYKNDLFSHKSRELDRELMGKDENNRIDASISSYLRLLSAHFQFPSALKTLEYLIRRYKIHVYNTEELILCSLPYHDNYVFVRIVQLIDPGNSKWKFLEGVKSSGAPPPRKVIVQQLIRDTGVLEVLCNYALPAKKYQPSRAVVSFCTVVVFEVLGSLTVIDSNVVKRVLPFVLRGLESSGKVRSGHKVGALMIVGLLANRAALSPDLVKTLICSIADVAQEDAKESSDLQLFRMSFMALINLVQLQSIEMFSKKVVDVLKAIRDIPGVLVGLTKEFNIDKFLSVLLDSLLEHSFSDEMCYHALISVIEKVPVKNFVDPIVSKLLKTCVRSYQKRNDVAAFELGNHAKQILFSINKSYPSELRGTIQSFLKENQGQSKNEGSVHEILCRILDRNLNSALEVSDSRIWFALEHPKAEVRRTTLSGLDTAGILKHKSIDSKRLETIQDAILRRLCDDDLSVVQAALNLDRLPELVNFQCILDVLPIILQRCIGILFTNASDSASLACDVAVACLNHVENFLDQTEYTEQLALMIFPLILILPKTWSVNLKALELAKGLKWPLFQNIVTVSNPFKKLEHGAISSINMDNICNVAEKFSLNPEQYVQWLVDSCKFLELSKTMFYLVLFQLFTMPEIDLDQFSALYETCFPILKNEWKSLECEGIVNSSVEESNTRIYNGDCKSFLDQLSSSNCKAVNAKIHISLFWKMLEAFIRTFPEDDGSGKDGSRKSSRRLEDLFLFFASQSKPVFKKHLHYLITKCETCPVRFLSKLFMEEGVSVAAQVESLHAISFLCSQAEEGLNMQLFNEFPSLLVPLSGDIKEARVAAMSCVEVMHTLVTRASVNRYANGNKAVWNHFIGELLSLMVQQKKLILSDRNVLSSFFTSLLRASSRSLLVPQTIGQRFDQSTKDEILGFIVGSALEFSTYGKLRILSLLKDVGSKVLLIKGVDSLLNELLERRLVYHIGYDKSCHKLSRTEVEILCLLLEICTKAIASFDHRHEDYILKALQFDGTSSEDPAILHPCTTVLRNLSGSLYRCLNTEAQELLFRDLVFLFHSANAEIQNSTRECLLHIDVTSLTIVHVLHFVLKQEGNFIRSSHVKKKKKGSITQSVSDRHHDDIRRTKYGLPFLSSLLDVLLLKKNIVDRMTLIGPLFKLVHIIFMDDGLMQKASDCDENYIQASSVISHTVSSSIVYIQQALLLILEDICASLIYGGPSEDNSIYDVDVELLIKCAPCAKDATTLNHVLSLLATIAKVMPDKVVDHILGILTIVGESTVTQWDSYSQRVLEDLISALVPCWLSKNDNTEKLLQIFVNVLPEVAEHRRVSIVVHLLRTMGESNSFGSFLVILFHSLVSRSFNYHDNKQSLDSLASTIHAEWEYVFAKQLCDQYSCVIWLPSLTVLLQKIEIGTWGKELFMELVVCMQLLSDKMQDPEIAFKIDSGEESNNIQRTAGTLVEQTVFHLQTLDSMKKQIPSVIRTKLKEKMHTVVRTISKCLAPSVYFRVITELLGHADANVNKKALGLLRKAVKDTGIINVKHGRKDFNSSLKTSWIHLDESSLESFKLMCLDIVKLVDVSDDESNTSLKLAAVSTLETLANRLPSNESICSMCLASITKNISSEKSAVSAICLHASGSLINALGPRALPELPCIMMHVLKRSCDTLSAMSTESNSNGCDAPTALFNSNESFLLSILVTLEAVVDKLGCFLNPYLGDILKIMVFGRQYISGSNMKLKLKADVVRKLITEKIPVRLVLPPLMTLYPEAIKSGDSSLSVLFEMLGNLIVLMDRSAIGAYHAKIFELCLQALDLRRQQPISVHEIDVVERDVINAMIALTIKLTETMFKPLFIKSIEWSESSVEEIEFHGSASFGRAVSFYGLVNKLAESHRSLFVPYFKYLLDSCVRHLADDESVGSGVTRKKKKAKLQEVNSHKHGEDNALSIERWHLRALILSSLHKCFLYDTGSLKLVDSSNFQVLLKPIVSQLLVDPPGSLDQCPYVPSMKQVDDTLVFCVGQMAVAAGNDLLWKPLNHEVLMQTRSEKVRARLLGLRIIKFLVEKLKEEFLVLLEETLPFLAELLEDAELPVKSLAQEILKDLESMSGENLRQHLR